MLVWIGEDYSPSARALLLAHGHKVTEDPGQAVVALIRSRTRINSYFLNSYPQLKLIVTATSGFDHVDWRECQTRNIVTSYTPEANARATAELTIGLLIAAERQFISAAKSVRTGKWREGLIRPRGLAGHTLAVIGLGRVGRRVARIAQALDMQVMAHDPFITEFGDWHRSGFTECLRAADYVTLHVPLTRTTLHLLNEPTFNEMQEDAVLINACRGPVVDENDLLAALDRGTIAGAAIDVVEREPPPPGHRVLNHPKLLMTPHIGAFTTEAWERSSLEAAQKVCDFARGVEIADTLPLNTPWFDRE